MLDVKASSGLARISNAIRRSVSCVLRSASCRADVAPTPNMMPAAAGGVILFRISVRLQLKCTVYLQQALWVVVCSQLTISKATTIPSDPALHRHRRQRPASVLIPIQKATDMVCSSIIVNLLLGNHFHNHQHLPIKELLLINRQHRAYAA